jgi:hypothetical protein
MVSVAGNIGHVVPLPGSPVTLTDRLTAAASPVAAFAGLMIGLLVLKMNQAHKQAAEDPAATRLELAGSADGDSADRLLADAAQIVNAALAEGEHVSQRALAGRLRERGHRFSNAQLRELATTAADRRAA